MAEETSLPAPINDPQEEIARLKAQLERTTKIAQDILASRNEALKLCEVIYKHNHPSLTTLATTPPPSHHNSLDL